MTTRRFMITSNCVVGDRISLEGDLFRHAARVLRINAGDQLTLVDEYETEYHGVVDRVEKTRMIINVTSSSMAEDTSGATPKITICQALPKGDKTELILQKCTELGTYDFILFEGARSVPRMVVPDKLTRKLERWNKVAAEASRQCGRRDIPAVRWFSDSCEAANSSSHELKLLLWEGEQIERLKDRLVDASRPATAIVVIGPEGGFEQSEVDNFRLCGFIPVSMGRRILRTETAALAIAAVLQYIWEGF